MNGRSFFIAGMVKHQPCVITGSVGEPNLDFGQVNDSQTVILFQLVRVTREAWLLRVQN